MKKSIRIISLLVLIVILACAFVACGDNVDPPTPDPDPDPPVVDPVDPVDYAAQVTFDPNSTTYKSCQVTVHQFIDGDTTHFNVPTSVANNGILKARYLAVNTPESTGQIEDYGHKASNFTKEKLSNATSIYVESDTTGWDLDSTGGRHLVWIWYKPQGSTTYRNLNIELLQEGLGKQSGTASNRYGTTAMAAFNQAKDLKLNVHSGVADPDMYRGDALMVSITQLRANIEYYLNKKVMVEGIITNNYGSSIYFENYDEDLDMWVGFNAYYGYGADSTNLKIMELGNKVRVVGTVQYYEAGGTYQISGITFYDPFMPDVQDCLRRVDDQKYDEPYQTVDTNTFLSGNVSVSYVDENGDDQTKSMRWAELALNASITMSDLKVISVSTTDNGGDNDGAFTLTCQTKDNKVIKVRTIVLYDDDKNIVDGDTYIGKTITVFGNIDYFSGSYQIKVYRLRDLIVQ